MKERNSNLELLRIISMCGIIVMHYFNSELGGAVQNLAFPNFSWLFTHMMNAICIPLVNCFVLITGFFLINTTVFSLKKSVVLVITTAFYGIMSYLMVAIVRKEICLDGLVCSLFPYFYGSRWFVETYIMLILFAPFLSKLLLTLNKENYQILLLIQMVFFSVWYSIGLSAPVLDDGYGIVNFITLYMIGGYICLFGDQSKIFSGNKRKDAITFVVCAIATFMLSYFINPYGYAFITNIIGATAIFLFFLKLDLGINRKINKISEYTFDVYFIHSDNNTSRFLIHELLGAKFVVDRPLMVVHLLLVVPIIWILGMLIGYFRRYFFSVSIDGWLTKVNFIDKKIDISK